jgi:hypothetical protein
MIFQKYYKNKNEGMILVDILLAFSLASVFAALIFESSVILRSVFEQARERNAFIDMYEANKDYFVGMIPYESRTLSIPVASSTVEIRGTARWYGNDRVETEIVIGEKVSFNTMRNYPALSDAGVDTKGTSICSVDFTRQGTLAITQITLPIDPLLPLTDLEVRNSIAYISTDSTRASDMDIIVANIADTSNPSILSSLNTGSGLSILSLVGNRIFAAAASTAAQIHVIRINSLNSLVLEHKYILPLPSTTTPPTIGSSIFYTNNHIYLGTDKWDGAEFVIFDASDPAHIVQQGGVEVGSKVIDIFVRQGIAYITTAAQQQLIVANVTDPLHPIIQNSFSPSGWSRQEGKDISFFEDRLVLGRTSGGFDIKTDHELFSWATSSVQDLASTTSFNSPGGVYGSVVDRSGMYVITRGAGKELQRFGPDVSQGPTASYSLPVAPQTLVCDNERLYVLANSAPVIYEISFK